MKNTIFTLIMLIALPINLMATPPTSNPSSQTNFVETTRIEALEAELELLKAARAAANTESFQNISPDEVFLNDLEVLRKNEENRHNAWLQKQSKSLQDSITMLHENITKKLGTKSTNKTQTLINEIKLRQLLEKDLIDKINHRILELNPSYQRCHWVLTFNNNLNKFVIIDTFNPQTDNSTQADANVKSTANSSAQTKLNTMADQGVQASARTPRLSDYEANPHKYAADLAQNKRRYWWNW